MVANSAFAVIKQTIENGRDISSAGAAIGKFVGAEDQLQQDLHKRKSSIWTNFLGKTDNDLEEFMALEQIRVKKDQLREFMQLYGRANLYNDYIQYCDARKARKEARIKAQRRREHIKDMVLKVILGILIATVLTGVIGVLIIIAKKKGII